MSKNSLDKIYEGNVFGKPSIQLDPFEEASPNHETKISDREKVINTYLPERFHVNKQKPQPKTGNSLKEKFNAKSNNTDQQMVVFLENYFKSERSNQLNSVEEILEDMYSFLRENQR